MNSFNHYSFGAVGSWMYNYSLGIQRDEAFPGFKHFILKPAIDLAGKMKYAKDITILCMDALKVVGK